MCTYCPNCGADLTEAPFVPTEPPIGTTVRDKYDGLITRAKNGRWGPQGCVPLASWGPMYRARGPLTIVKEN